MLGRALTATVVASALIVPLVAVAEHEAPDGEDFFDHRGGNEWWIELQLDPKSPSASYGYPFVKDEGGPWLVMDRPSWAPNPNYFVKSFHIEPGNDVRFKIQFKGSGFLSCWYSHPEGVERCDGTEHFSATFKNARGNAHWIETDIEANHGIRDASATIVGTSYWHQMQRTDWGSWAASFYVPGDQVVRFFATSARTSETVDSGCYQWPQAEPVECPEPEFRASPTEIHGDETFVDAVISPGFQRDLAEVEVRADWGAWTPLEFQENRVGNHERWAGSVDAPDDSVLQFRAVSPEGDVACRQQGWDWVPPEGGSAGLHNPSNQIAWGNAQGNEWWVQISTVTSPRILVVQASVDKGPWQNLEMQSWCDWASSIHVNDGSWVTFRAVLYDSSTWGGPTMEWPPAS